MDEYLKHAPVSISVVLCSQVCANTPTKCTRVFLLVMGSHYGALSSGMEVATDTRVTLSLKGS